MGKNVGKNISKNLSGKCNQKLFDHARQSRTDAFLQTEEFNSRSNWWFDW